MKIGTDAMIFGALISAEKKLKVKANQSYHQKSIDLTIGHRKSKNSSCKTPISHLQSTSSFADVSVSKCELTFID